MKVQICEINQIADGRLNRNIMIYQLLNSCFVINPGVYLHLEIF